MPPVVAGAAIAGGASLGAAYLSSRSANKASDAQRQAQEQAAQAEKERLAEEERRYRERWEEHMRQVRDYEARRKAAQDSGKKYRLGGKPVDSANVPSQLPQQVPTYGVNPVTGKPRTLGEIATSWNDWGQYGLS